MQFYMQTAVHGAGSTILGSINFSIFSKGNDEKGQLICIIGDGPMDEEKNNGLVSRFTGIPLCMVQVLRYSDRLDYRGFQKKKKRTGSVSKTN